MNTRAYRASWAHNHKTNPWEDGRFHCAGGSEPSWTLEGRLALFLGHALAMHNIYIELSTLASTHDSKIV